MNTYIVIYPKNAYKRMKKNWTASLDDQQANEVKESFNASTTMRKRLMELLNDKIVVKRKEALSKDAYQHASWPYLQADAIGYERALSEVISLISSESVEKP